MVLTPKLLLAITASESTTLFSLLREELHGDREREVLKPFSLKLDSHKSNTHILEHRPLSIAYKTPTCCKVVFGYESHKVVGEAKHASDTCNCEEGTTEDSLK